MSTSKRHFHEFDYNAIEADRKADAMEAPRAAWCANCDGPVELDEQGRCIGCADNGDAQDVEEVVAEPVPQTSPRSIECRLCGADIGEYCRPGEDGGGYNHTARVEQLEADRGLIS